MKKLHTKERGITIITLVITIIILLILAGISIASLIGNDGLINKAKKAAKDYENAQEDELAKLNNILEYSIEEGNTENQSEVIVELVKEVSKLKEEMSNLKTVNLEDMYPVGAIYMSMEDKNPSELFGGEWEKLENRFLIGASSTYNIGTTGGNTSINYTPSGTVGGHTLTLAELPNFRIGNSSIVNANYNQNGNYAPEAIDWGRSNSNMNISDMFSGGGNGAHTHPFAGKTENINTMNPYLAVYMWKRIK